MKYTPMMTAAERLSILDEMPPETTKVEFEAEIARRLELMIPKDLRWGDRVRTVGGHTTGRYLGSYGGKDLVGWVSAMSNDLCIGEVAAGIPSPDMPVPSDAALSGMCAGLSSNYARCGKCARRGEEQA